MADAAAETGAFHWGGVGSGWSASGSLGVRPLPAAVGEPVGEVDSGWEGFPLADFQISQPIFVRLAFFGLLRTCTELVNGQCDCAQCGRRVCGLEYWCRRLWWRLWSTGCVRNRLQALWTWPRSQCSAERNARHTQRIRESTGTPADVLTGRVHTVRDRLRSHRDHIRAQVTHHMRYDVFE